MLKYALKRILLAMVSVFVIMAIAFFSMNAIPGGPFAKEKAPEPAVQAVLEKRFNLDKPVMEQFFLYISNIFQGDFGISLKTGREISTTIFESFSISAKLGGYSILIALIMGLILGSTAALTRNKWPDQLIVFFTTLSVGMPSFVLGTLLLLVFSLILKVVPAWSIENQNYVLPIIALSLYPTAHITRLTKSSLLDVFGQDYIRTARAKGVPRIKVIVKHALRNALIPVITYIGPLTAYSLTGSMVIETIFTIGGLGTKFVTGITNQDYPMIMGTTIFLAILMVIMTLISDLLYRAVDPRISFD
ncbi:MAG: ABC transporter permease [Christensenellaceae bacterium]|mgnify:CR=1 FL=1|nr:ABC transporter permease [Christensenellaceae bacterium]